MLGYKVCYQRADQKHSLLFCTAVYGFGLELGGLSHYKPYLVTVLAFTNEGEGPPCKPILVRTDEFGKCKQFGHSMYEALPQLNPELRARAACVRPFSQFVVPCQSINTVALATQYGAVRNQNSLQKSFVTMLLPSKRIVSGIPCKLLHITSAYCSYRASQSSPYISLLRLCRYFTNMNQPVLLALFVIIWSI